MDNIVSFSAGLNQSTSLTAHQQVMYDRVINTEASQIYDLTTGTFTAPTSGIYVFHYHALATKDQVIVVK